MCTGAPTMAPVFASNGCERTLEMVQKRPPKCVIDTTASLSSFTNKPAGLLQRGRNVETLDASKHRTTIGCHDRPIPARFELDVQW